MQSQMRPTLTIPIWISFDDQSSSEYSVFSGLADHWHYSNTSLCSRSSTIITSPVLAPSSWLLYTKRYSLECVLKGSSTVRYQFLCASTCTLAREDQLFPGLGLYSGLFAVYLQCSSNKSRTAIIYFYTLCLLYVLSIASILSDLIVAILQVSNNPIYKSVKFLSVVQIHISIPSSQPQIDLQSILFHLSIFQKIANGCCDFIAQCILVRMKHCTYHPFYLPKSSKIYRCWIVWGQNIRVVIIPSFLAVAYLGQSISGLFSFVKPISNFFVSSYLASAKWRSNICTRSLFESCLGDHGDSSKFPFVHGREYPGDGLDRVQDPQGVLGN